MWTFLRVSEQPLEDSEDFFTATDDEISLRDGGSRIKINMSSNIFY